MEAIKLSENSETMETINILMKQTINYSDEIKIQLVYNRLRQCDEKILNILYSKYGGNRRGCVSLGLSGLSETMDCFQCVKRKQPLTCETNLKKLASNMVVKYAKVMTIINKEKERKKFAKRFKALPPDIHAQILSAMKPKNLAIFSLINRYWSGFCRSDKMQGYWYQHLLTYDSSFASKYILETQSNWYELYLESAYEKHHIAILAKKSQALEVAESQEDQIVAVDDCLKFLTEYPKFPIILEKYPGLKNIIQIRLRDFFLIGWEKANEYHRIIFNSSMIFRL